MKTPETQQFRDIRSVRVIDWHKDNKPEFEVNEALKLGWQLLLLQPTEKNIVFVIGWPGEGKPLQTEKEKQDSK